MLVLYLVIHIFITVNALFYPVTLTVANVLLPTAFLSVVSNFYPTEIQNLV